MSLLGPPPDDYKDEQELWDAHNRTLLQKGKNLNRLLLQWVKEQKDSYRDPRSTIEFDELCNHGCVPQVLAILLSFVRFSPKLVDLWSIIVGGPESRRILIKSLENAAEQLERSFDKLIESENEEQRKSFRSIGRIPPATLVAELRLYASALNLAERLKIDVETRSPEEFARFLLTYYVKRCSGRFHDRKVATLYGEVMNLEAYEESAQRMWRDRNYERLAKHYSKFGDFPYAMGVVIARQT